MIKKVNSIREIVFEAVSVNGKTAVDVGCGTGDTVRWLAGEGARVTGVDVRKMIAKAEKESRVSDERYLTGRAENLPIEDHTADIVLFMASLHHVPASKMMMALCEASRILKAGGEAVVLEPLIDCSYYQITRLVEEETDIRAQALDVINKSDEAGLETVSEKWYYLERSFADFQKLLDVFFDGTDDERAQIETKAKKIQRELSRETDCDPAQYLFQSAVRVRLLRKI